MAGDREPQIIPVAEKEDGTTVSAGAVAKKAPVKKAGPGKAARTGTSVLKTAVKKTAVKRNAVKRTAAKKTPVKKASVKKSGALAAVKIAPARSAGARAAVRLGRRLAGIRAAAGELAKVLDDIEKAREALEGQFQHAADANLARARGALDMLIKAAEARPLLDARRLERDLALLVESSGDLKALESRGRKRDILAVDDFLGDVARRLELAVTGTAADNLKLLNDRLVEMEAMREKLRKAVRERFRSRLQLSRSVLGSLDGAAVRLAEERLARISRELEGALAIGKALPAGKLAGKPKDLYGIDGMVKQVARRLDRVQRLLAVKTEESDG